MAKKSREDRICLRCIGDEDLRDLLKEEAARGKCRFCEYRRLSVPLKTLAAQIDEVYRENFELGSCYSMPGPGADDHTYHCQEGDSPSEIIQRIAEVEPEVAEAVVKILSDEEFLAVRDGDEPYYENGWNYAQRSVDPFEQKWTWNVFYQRIRLYP